ncbi:MAG: glycosyltransferase family 4 protein [Candidatus Scalindua sp. AMX11]|nr:MAG: glycosyltransferase family 4 protein [Candidatus Scalindua sp.]NOG82710.1 glycosyltransferase family 4 protein [Planctomycetota bacterium]RZV95282.1 MAG: glycosyltransferase family 4 protein [Candidatus Scalindua sp. SCAELEC01]TDE66238.1 MAG: glycosyltransferase family 4 protein [Candidatus Scalindua sp. AMX11]GJQ57860.1 MAG: glycosyl transferase family 1 [Candidatus Scalindua sp.]
MKTLLISEIFPPKTGGSGRWFFEVYSRLSRKDYIICAGNDEEADAFDSGSDVNIIRLPLSLSDWGVINPKCMFAYLRLFLRILIIIRREGVEAIHCGRSLPEGLLGWLVWKFTKIPFLCYVHGEELATFQKSRELVWLSRKVFTGATYIIVNSRNTKRLLTDYLPTIEKKIQILHPGVNVNYFKPVSANKTIRSELGWKNRLVILTVGRLQRRKGHDVAILSLKAVKNTFPNVLYAIAGAGEEREPLEHLVNEDGLNENVQFLGEIDDETLLKCYQQCDLFLLANREVDGDIEGFGMVLVEAQSCGKPVIAGDSGGTIETMIPGKSGLIIDCRESTRLATALNQLLDESDTRKSMGRNAVKWVNENFDWNSLVVKAEDLFGNISR